MRLRRTLCGAFAAILVATLALVGALALVPGSARAASQGRVEMSFNNDWRFWEGNVSGADAADYDDSEWLYVNVPHSTIKYTSENYYHEDLGVFWYRRHFETPETVQDGRRALITFGAAMQKAEVWLNGEKLGTHEGGYTGFSYDITDKLAPAGEENVLAVKLDTNPNAAFAPGKNNPDFQYFGGLYRNVTLTVTDPVHVTDAVSSGTVGGGGVFLATTALADDHSFATVNAKTEVENSGAEAQVTVKTEFLNEDGSVAAETQSEQAVPAGEKITFSQDVSVSNPSLWSTDTPELYTVRTTVFQNGEARDSVETTFGIRAIEWVRDSEGTACLINGERVHLNGTNLHSEINMLGNAASDDAIDAEIKRLREYGFNFVRMAHYPHSQAFYDACDKYGVAVLDCLSCWQQFNNTEAFKNNTYQQIREMVRANRNHASIVAWEPSLNESSYSAAWAREANATTKAEYPDNGVAKAWTCGWIHWDAFDMGCGTPQANVNGDAGRYADKPVIVSEYGDWNYGGYDSTTRVTREPTHYNDAKGGDEGMLQQADNAQASYAWNRTKSWSGEYGATAFWQYADYAGFDVDKLTYCGVVDVARIPKFSAYFFQSQRDPSVDLSAYGLDSGPMIYIANSWADDSPSEVRVYTNCDEVEIFVDGVSVERRDTPDATMWDARATMSDDGSGQPSPLETNGEGGTGDYVSTEGIEYPPFTFDLTDEATPGEDVKPGDDQKPGSDDVKPGNDQQGTSDPDDQQGDKRPSDDVKPSDEKPAGSASDDAALPSAGEAADPTASLLTLGLLATASAVAVRGARRER